MHRPSALVIEDSSEYLAIATRLLEGEGFRVTQTGSGEHGVELARAHRPELLIVDVTLPGIDGFEVCRQVRTFSDAYIVMVTARDEDLEKVVGFRLGADDYVTKPYSAAELSARIGALRRRPRQIAVDSHVRTFDGLSVDTHAREVVLDGEHLALTKIEFDLLELLSAAPRRAFTRLNLLEAVWGYAGGDDHVVDVHVANLRRKLGESASHQVRIRTVRGVGYRFDPTPPATISAASASIHAAVPGSVPA